MARPISSRPSVPKLISARRVSGFSILPDGFIAETVGMQQVNAAVLARVIIAAHSDKSFDFIIVRDGRDEGELGISGPFVFFGPLFIPVSVQAQEISPAHRTVLGIAGYYITIIVIILIEQLGYISGSLRIGLGKAPYKTVHIIAVLAILANFQHLYNLALRFPFLPTE